MNGHRIFSALFRAATLTFGLSLCHLHAGVADQAARTQVAGVDVIAYKTIVRDVVSFCGSLPAGTSFAPEDNLAIPTLVVEMLDKGTTTQDQFVIAQKLDAVGATLRFSVDTTMVIFEGQCLRKDLPLVIGLLAEQLRSPTFAEDELAKVQKYLEAQIQSSLDETAYRANQAFAAAVYPLGHPNYEQPPDVFLNAVKTATVAELRAFHKKFYGPAGLTLIAVGDVNATQLQADVALAFDSWSGGQRAPGYPNSTAPKDVTPDQTVYMADRANVKVILGQATHLRHSDPDALPLTVATAILGSGFTGRLMATVRDQEGLTYDIDSYLSNDTYTDGDWRINANFAPDLLEKGLASIRRELKAWYENGVTDQELARTKANLAGKIQVKLSTTDVMAYALLRTVNRGYPLSWVDEYPQQLKALSVEQVNAAIKQHLNPDSFVLIKAGTVATPGK